MSLATREATGFGLRDVSIAAIPTAPNTSPTWVKIPSVESANFELSTEEEEQWGDDIQQDTFYHSQSGTIVVTTNKLNLAVFEQLSGVAVSANADVESLYFGTQKELLPPRVMVRGIIPTRNADGTPGTLTVYWFNCNVRSLWENAPGNERATIMTFELNFNCYPSTTNERGNAIPAGLGHAYGRFDLDDA